MTKNDNMKPKKIIALLAATGLLALQACKKSTTVAEEKTELVYKGSTEALSEGRHRMDLLQVGDYTCFAGGFISMYQGASVLTYSYNIDVYNRQTGQWIRFGMSPQRTGFGITAAGGKLFIAGGTNSDNRYIDNLNIIDLASGRVTNSTLSVARRGVAATTAGNKVLFAGGTAASGASNKVDIYDLQTGQWTAAVLSEARHSITAVSAGNIILFAGGVTGSNAPTSRVDLYNVQTGQWSVAETSVARSFSNAVVAGNKIFISKKDISSLNSQNIDVYDAEKNQWSALSLTGSVGQVSMAASAGYVFFTSSSINGIAEKLHVYHLRDGQLKTVAVPVPVSEFAIAAVGTKVMIAGGFPVSSLGVENRVQVYDVATGVFDVASFTLRDKCAAPVAATAGNKILIAGGYREITNSNGQLTGYTNYKTVNEFELIKK
jgi:hypothetical protein